MCRLWCVFFFCSSRRRHTRCSRDWSSDVCSSDLIDVGPSAVYFAGGQKAIDNLPGIDGKSLFKPEMTLFGGSPVKIHLYDSEGRHVGYDLFGNVETEIPTSDFQYFPETDKKLITLLQARDNYTIDIEAFGAGTFDLVIQKNTPDESFVLNFVNVSIQAGALGRINFSESLDLMLDYDGDGTFETFVGPPTSIPVSESDNNASIHIRRMPSGSQETVDVTSSVGSIIGLATGSSIDDGQINYRSN